MNNEILSSSSDEDDEKERMSDEESGGIQVSKRKKKKKKVIKKRRMKDEEENDDESSLSSSSDDDDDEFKEFKKKLIPKKIDIENEESDDDDDDEEDIIIRRRRGKRGIKKEEDFNDKKVQGVFQAVEASKTGRRKRKRIVVNNEDSSTSESESDDDDDKKKEEKKKIKTKKMKDEEESESESESSSSSSEESEEEEIKKTKRKSRKSPRKKRKIQKKRKVKYDDDDEEEEEENNKKKMKMKDEEEEGEDDDDEEEEVKEENKEKIKKNLVCMGEDGKEMFKWWLDTKFLNVHVKNSGRNRNKKWNTLEHHGVLLAEEYKPLPSKVNLYCKKKKIKFDQKKEEELLCEEMAYAYATFISFPDYFNNQIFKDNFWNDWKKKLRKAKIYPGKIAKLEDCDFTKIYEYHVNESEKRKKRTKEEKEKEKKKRDELEKDFLYCVVDGRKEKVGNFRVEKPGLFRGRGKHPLMGKWKKRILPHHISINIGKTSNAPKPPKGYKKWKEVVKSRDGIWLAKWNDPVVDGSVKYVRLASSSSYQGLSDYKKYEKARILKGKINKIRREYKRMINENNKIEKQMGVVMYFIDKLSLRVGNDKNTRKKADTVGACSLRVEHLKILEKESSIKLDFLGKDSIRYEQTSKVEKEIISALKRLIKGKSEEKKIFHKISVAMVNNWLKKRMKGLSGKVFRTYNASILLCKELRKEKSNFYVRTVKKKKKRSKKKLKKKKGEDEEDMEIISSDDEESEDEDVLYSKILKEQQKKEKERNKRNKKKKKKKTDDKKKSNIVVNPKKELIKEISRKKRAIYKYKKEQFLMEKELKEKYKGCDDKDFVRIYNDANKKVAILCNHQKTVKKETFSNQMSRVDDQINDRKQFLKDLMEIEKIYVRRQKRKSSKKKKSSGSSNLGFKGLKEKDQNKITKIAKKHNRLKKTDYKSRLSEVKGIQNKYERLSEEKNKSIAILLKVEGLDSKILKEPKEPKVVKFPQSLNAVKTRIRGVKNQIKEYEKKKNEKTAMKSVSLGTSKINYCDPRITISWCKRNMVPVPKVFSKSLRLKFPWSLDVKKDFKF